MFDGIGAHHLTDAQVRLNFTASFHTLRICQVAIIPAYEVRSLLYDYTSESAVPTGNRALYTRSYFYPFVAVFSPFSYSVLAEISRRAWFHYYTRLGAEIAFAPKTLVYNADGRPYLDLKWLCEQDVAFAGLQPPVLRLNGAPVAICAWEKPGLLAAFKLGRNQKKIADLLNSLSNEMPAITARIQGWHKKVLALRWTQAEILQIMEEIEQFGTQSLMAYFAARHNLERSHNELVNLLPGDNAHQLHLINSALSDLDGLTELRLTGEILALARLAAADSKLMAWLAQPPTANWTESVPPGRFADVLRHLLAGFGHWATDVGEMAHPTWTEKPELLLSAIVACAKSQATEPQRAPSSAARQQLLDSVPGGARKQAEQLLASLAALTILQSQALHAFAYLLAGTRTWALAAGAEAAADGRLLDPQDVFLFELEEIKQMMTGEWNITHTNEIRQRAEDRRSSYARWQTRRAPAAFFGDAPAWLARPGLPSNAATSGWRVPALGALGAAYDELVDGSAGTVEQ